nr:MAG TPA: hypothetical protein [Caudoviricetes sp.]
MLRSYFANSSICSEFVYEIATICYGVDIVILLSTRFRHNDGHGWARAAWLEGR